MAEETEPPKRRRPLLGQVVLCLGLDVEHDRACCMKLSTAFYLVVLLDVLQAVVALICLPFRVAVSPYAVANLYGRTWALMLTLGMSVMTILMCCIAVSALARKQENRIDWFYYWKIVSGMLMFFFCIIGMGSMEDPAGLPPARIRLAAFVFYQLFLVLLTWAVQERLDGLLFELEKQKERDRRRRDVKLKAWEKQASQKSMEMTSVSVKNPMVAAEEAAKSATAVAEEEEDGDLDDDDVDDDGDDFDSDDDDDLSDYLSDEDEETEAV